MRHLSTLALTGLVLVLAACGKKPEPVVPAPAAEQAPAPTVDRDAEEAARRAREEAERRAAEEARRREATLTEMVFFDFDMSVIRADQRAILDAKVPILREHAGVRIRIEGHADDRGSTEYNLALGERRAQAIKDYLVGFGLEEGRFETVSYGEERPLVRGADDVSWARNRRGEFTVTAGSVVAERDR